MPPKFLCSLEETVHRSLLLSARSVSGAIGTVVAAVVLSGSAAGCSVLDRGPSCSDFNDASSEEQISMVADWMDDHNMTDVLGEGGSAYLPEMTEYCSASGHEDDRLKDLELTYGF